MNIIFKKSYSNILCIPSLSFYLLFFILPTLASFFLAFTNWSTYDFNNIKFNGVENLVDLFTTDYLAKAIWNTFYFAIVTVIFKTVIGLILAILLTQDLKFKSFYKSAFFMPYIISPLVIAVVFGAIYNPQVGLINTFFRYVGLGFLCKEWLFDAKYAMNSICFVEIWQWTGFTMMIFIAGLMTIQKDYYDAAEIDGANGFQKFFNMILPLIMPSVTITVVLNLIIGLKVFAQVYGLTNGGPADATQVFSTLIYKNFASGLLGMSSAIGLIFTLVISILGIIVLVILRRMEVEL